MIEGVVSPDRQIIWAGRYESYGVHHFSFTAWRRPGKPVVRRQLMILRPAPPLAQPGNYVPELSILQIRVLLSDTETRALFVEELPMDSPDEELSHISDELQPLIVSTELFGDLVLNRTHDLFDGEAEWNGGRVEVHVPSEGDLPSQPAMESARVLWRNQASWKRRIEYFAVAQLLDDKNAKWLEEGEPKWQREEFISRMNLSSISFAKDGDFEFWYEDGDIFCCHSIVVYGNLEDGPTDCGIHG